MTRGTNNEDVHVAKLLKAKKAIYKSFIKCAITEKIATQLI